MKFHTPAELRDLQADATFRTSPWGAVLLPAALLAWCVLLSGASVKGYVEGTTRDPIFWAGIAVLALLVPVTLRSVFMPTLNRTTNWVLKVKGNRLYLMLRNYRNTHLPDDDPVIVSFETNCLLRIQDHENVPCG